MYYYLFESGQTTALKRWQARCKEKLTEFGVGGESVAPSPARTIDELVLMGFDKGYTTTVAIGSDLFINKVASSLIYHSIERKKSKIVLGAIPTAWSASQFGDFLGVRNETESIQALRSRYLVQQNIGFIEPNKFFITPVEIVRPQPFICTVKTSAYQATVTTTQLTIDASGYIQAEPPPKRTGLLGLLNSLYPKRLSDNKSKFQVGTAELASQEFLPITLAGETIAKTPIMYHSLPNLLYLIVNRDSINQ